MSNGHWETCCNHQCKVVFWIPPELYEAALRRRGPQIQGGIQFYCPYGHSQHYVDGEHPEAKLRRERDLLKQQLAERNDEISRQYELRKGAERQLASTRGVVTRIKNRVGHGVCPCCTRTFQNLSQHMRNQHPDYAKSPAESP